MFYLKKYIELLIKNPFRGGFFFLANVLLFSLAICGPMVKKAFWDYFGDPIPYPYFYLTYQSDTDIDEVKGKLVTLPGIKEVSIGKPQEMRQRAQELLSELHVPDEFLPALFKVIKVKVEKGFSEKSFALLTEYLKQLTHDDEMTVTSLKVKSEEEILKEKRFMFFLRNWGDFSVSSLIILCWILSFIMIKGVASQWASILQSYQRRQYIERKILLVGTLCYNIILVVTFIYGERPYWVGPLLVNLLLIGFIFLVTKRRPS